MIARMEAVDGPENMSSPQQSDLAISLLFANRPQFFGGRQDSSWWKVDYLGLLHCTEQNSVFSGIDTYCGYGIAFFVLQQHPMA